MKRLRFSSQGLFATLAILVAGMLWLIVSRRSPEPFSRAVEEQWRWSHPRIARDQAAVCYWIAGSGNQVFDAQRVLLMSNGRQSGMSVSLLGAPRKLFQRTTGELYSLFQAEDGI